MRLTDDLYEQRRAGRYAAWLSSIVLGVLLGAACSGPKPAPAALHRSLFAVVATVDAQRAADAASYEVLRDLGEGLTCETAGGEIEPGVAADWTVSPDGRRYDFRLRPEARWSNGDPVVAEDFVASLRRAVDPKTASPSAYLLSVIRHADQVIAGALPVSALGVSAPDQRSLSIELERPAPYFTALLAAPIAYPVHRPTLARYGDHYARAGQLVSNGAYRLDAELPGGRLRLSRNPYYWAQARVAIASVEYVPIPDAQAELNRYRAGEIDVTSLVPAADFDWLKATLPGELQVRPQLGLYYFAFNLSHPPFNDQPILREALSLALDREQLVSRVLKAGQLPAYAFVPPGIGGYEPSTYGWAVEPVDARRARAQLLYKRAGFGPGHPLRLRLLYSQSDTIRNVSIAAAEQWHAVLGAEVELNDMEFRAFLAKRAERAAWDVLIDGWNADYPDPGNFLELLRSRGPQNDPGYADPGYDRLLDEAAAEADPARRLAIYGAAERRLLASYAVAPVYYMVSRRLVRTRVEGATLSPMNHNYTKHMSLKPTAAQRGGGPAGPAPR